MSNCASQRATAPVSTPTTSWVSITNGYFPEAPCVAEVLSPVDHERLPCHPARRVGDEKRDDRTDVFGLADTAQRGGRIQTVLMLFPQRLGEFGPHHARRHRV